MKPSEVITQTIMDGAEALHRMRTENARLTGEIKRLIEENEEIIATPFDPNVGTNLRYINTRLASILEPDAKRGKEEP